MKNSRRILSAFLVIAMLISCFMAVPVFADEADTTTTTETEATETTVSDSGTPFPDVNKKDSYALAVTTLSKLSIIDGYPDGTFGPLKNITRAEFAALLLRMLDMDNEMAPTAMPFPDVPTNLWAAGTIEMAKNMKIVDGYPDGTFKPDNNVSYEEALTMLIRAIGYENYSGPGVAWYSRYVESARRLGILKNAVGAVGTPATRSCIAQFIYNTLEVNSRTNDRISALTIMEEYLGIKKASGIIASNGLTSLDTPDINLRDNEIMIRETETGETDIFRVDNIKDYRDKLGYYITYYYEGGPATDYRDIIMFNVKDATKTETINASLIEPNLSDALSIAYYRNDEANRTSNINLAEDNVVIYNEKLWGNSDEDSVFDVSMIPELGQIKVLNTDGDGDYDILFIDSYEAYVVSSVSSATYTITDKITRKAGRDPLVLDYEDDDQIINFVDEDGEEKKFSDIKKNQSICVKESHDNNGTKVITVVIKGAGVSGEVKSVSNKGVTVGTKEYKYSSFAPWVAKDGDDTPAPVKGDTYTFYLDLNDEIIGYTKTASAVNTVNYGYLLRAVIDDDDVDNITMTVEILPKTGSTVKPALYDNTKINGRSINGDYDLARDLLEDGAKLQNLGVDESDEDKGVRQLIKYSTRQKSGKTVVDSIVTVESTSKEEDEKLTLYDGFDSRDTVAYDKTKKLLTGNGESVYLSNATVFIVPKKLSEVKSYKRGTASNIAASGNHLEVFDVTDSGSATIVVLYSKTEASASAGSNITSLTGLFRVEDWESQYNDSEEKNMIRIWGYLNGASKETPYWVSPESEDAVEDLKKGDIVRFGLDKDGFSKIFDASKDILFDASDYLNQNYFFAHDDSKGKDTAAAREYDKSDLKFIVGSVYSLEKDGSMLVVPQFLEDDSTLEGQPLDSEWALRVSNVKSISPSVIFDYDMSDPDDVEITTTEDFDPAITLTPYLGENGVKNTATKVIVQLSGGSSVKTLIILRD